MLVIFGATATFAGDNGRPAFGFLRLGESVRQAALGTAGVADAAEAGNGHLNPAVLGEVRAQEARFAHSRLFDDASLSTLGYARPLARWGVGGQFLYQSYGEIAGYDALGAQTGTTDASDKALSVSLARRGDNVIPGATLKLAQQTLAGVSAFSPALDVGVLLRAPAGLKAPPALGRQLERMTFGAAARNLGYGVKFERSTEPLPRSFALGLTHRSFADALTLSFDIESYLGRAGLSLHLGGEYWLRDGIALRAGYRTDTDVGPGASMGIGFKLGQARLDYAFQPFDELGAFHRIGLSVRFGSAPLETHYQNGVRDMLRGNYAEAILEFDKALAINPEDRRVLRKAMEAADALKKQLGEDSGAAPSR